MQRTLLSFLILLTAFSARGETQPLLSAVVGAQNGLEIAFSRAAANERKTTRQGKRKEAECWRRQKEAYGAAGAGIGSRLGAIGDGLGLMGMMLLGKMMGGGIEYAPTITNNRTSPPTPPALPTNSTAPVDDRVERRIEEIDRKLTRTLGDAEIRRLLAPSPTFSEQVTDLSKVRLPVDDAIRSR